MDKNMTYTMKNGIKIPAVGFGTYLVDNDTVKKAVLDALEAGYRHIDTAFLYQNEKGVGEAIRESGLKREELFITSKVWFDMLGYEKTKQSFETSMERLGLDYLDLFLIHWPKPEGRESWKAMEAYYDKGVIKGLGVSNYKPDHLEDLMASANIMPMVNQIECHPFLQQEETVAFCKEQGILVEAWSPIMKGHVMRVGVMKDIAEKYGKTPVQIALRWHLQRGLIVLPKSVHTDRIAANLDFFDFELEDGDMALIRSLDRGFRFGYDPSDIFDFGKEQNREERLARISAMEQEAL